MRKNRGGSKARNSKPPRSQERNSIPEGVYSNNYFMHAATSHVGAVVKIETVQGSVYEGIFKTFSHEFDVVLELAHKVDSEDPQKLNTDELVDNLIFQCKDIVNMRAPNIEPDYAFNNSTSFAVDTAISRCNGEVTGEKTDLQPWEDPMLNGEEIELDDAETTQNGWDANEMFMTNEKFGVQTTYDDTLSDYTCKINRKDTKDFKEEEAKAARIAMEIERNPSSQSRLMLENGDNEEDLYAAVVRPDNDGSKYIPPARRAPPHRSSGGNPRMNYSPNGNGGRPPKNSNAAQPRYMHQTPQQYHAQPYGMHPSAGNRSSSENKNSQMSSSQSQNVSSYPPANVHGQRSYPPNVVPVSNHSQQNVPIQQSKSQRTSPISVNTLPNGNVDYQPKSLPSVSQSPPHQYHNQNQQSQNQGGNNALNPQQQRKHHQSHHHQNNSRGREEQINDLKKFGTDFNLYEHKDSVDGGPKQIQVVTNRNKSPPVSQSSNSGPTERNVVPVTIVSTVSTLPPPNKFTNSGPATTPPQAALGPPAASPTTAGSVSSIPTTQVGHKQHPIVLPTQYQQPIQLQQRGDSPMLLQHQAPPMTQTAPPHSSHHPQAMQPPPQQGVMQQKQPPHKVPMHPQGVLPPQTSVQLQQHPATSPQQTSPVITAQNAPMAAVVTSAPPQSIVTQPTVPQQGGMTAPQTGGLPLNVHQRPPLQQQQQPPLKSQNQSSVVSAEHSTSPSSTDATSDTDSIKGKDGDNPVDDISQRVKNVRLNPDAKEYVPAVKSFTPISRSPSTPTQSRPHTPQTPSSYNIHPGNAPVAAGIQMMVPAAYVLSASPGHVPPPAQSRIRKAPVNSHRTSDYHTSNIPVSAVTGQPLLAPPVPLTQSHIGHGTSFSVPYTHYPQLVAASHHSPLQMIRMVQPGSMVPLVPNSIGYHEPGTNATAVYVNPGSNAAVAMAQHTPHVHHPQQHPPPSTAPSPSQTPQGQSQSHTPNSYQHPPLAAQSASPYTPIMCPVLSAQPTHGPPHMVAAQAQQHAAVQQYMSQHPSVTPPHILSLIPHSCS